MLGAAGPTKSDGTVLPQPSKTAMDFSLSSLPLPALSPSLTPLLSAPPAIQIHAVSAMAAMLLGAVVLFRTKGTSTHRFLGRVWVLLMLLVATSSIFITEIRMIGPFSPIHIFTIATYLTLAQAMVAIRRGNVAMHRAAMQSLYCLALLITGAFTLLPGRRMHDVLFGAQSGWGPAIVAISLSLALSLALYIRLMRRGRASPASPRPALR